MEYSDKPKNQNIGNNNNKDKIEKDECATKVKNEKNNEQAGSNNEQNEQAGANNGAAGQNANNTTPSNDELMKQLGILNLSVNSLYVILLAVIMNDECATKVKNEKNNEQAGAKNEQNEQVGANNGAAEQNANNITPSNAELMKQLGILNLSLSTLYVILLAVILNIDFVKYERAKLLDQINKTNLSKDLPDLSDTPRITNIMFLYATGVFLDINYNAFKDVSSVKGKNRNPRAIRRAWKSFLSTILTFIATAISRDNLEL